MFSHPDNEGTSSFDDENCNAEADEDTFEEKEAPVTLGRHRRISTIEDY